MKTLKKLVWLYFWLVLGEGALRKWLLPELDTALLLIRDPLVLLCYLQALRIGVFPWNAQLGLGVILVLLTGAAGLMAGAPAAVLAFGMRTSFFHLPLIYLIPRIFDRDDVLKMGRFLLYTTPFMAMLFVYQFASPQESWINKGAFGTHYDSVRPSGTFPFVTGTALYLSFAAAYIAYGFLQKGRLPLWLLLTATPSVLASLAVSGSRLAVTAVAVVGLCAVGAVVVRGKGFGGVAAAGGIICLAMVVLGNMHFFQEGRDQLNRRFEDASPDQNSDTAFITSRVSGDTELAIRLLGTVPLLGHGTGLGTSVGSQLTIGERVFLGAEGEWGRLIWESGPILGIGLILYRTWLAFGIGLTSFKALRRGEFLGILLFGACAFNLVQGQWGVTNVQGFACLEAGLALAACRRVGPLLVKSIPYRRAALPRRSRDIAPSTRADGLASRSGGRMRG